MFSKAKFQHDNLTYDIRVFLGLDEIFLFKNSLPENIIPKIGDVVILDFEDSHFYIKSVTPLFSENNEWSNYALDVEVK